MKRQTKDEILLRQKLWQREYYKRNRILEIERRKKFYSKNKESILDYQKEHMKERRRNPELQKKEKIRAETQYKFRDFKVKCDNCKRTNDLQFHHTKPYQADKFMVLCKNCHLKQHSKEKGYE